MSIKCKIKHRLCWNLHKYHMYNRKFITVIKLSLEKGKMSTNYEDLNYSCIEKRVDRF